MSSQSSTLKLHTFSQQFLPVSILLDDRKAILAHEGNTAHYLLGNQFSGQVVEQVLLPPLKAPFAAAFDQLQSGGEACCLRIRNYKPGEQVYDLNLMLSPGEHDDGTPTYMLILQPLMPENLLTGIHDAGMAEAHAASAIADKIPHGRGTASPDELPTIQAQVQSLQVKYDHFKNIINNIPGAVIRYQINTDGSDELIYLSEQAELLWEISGQDALENVALLWEPVLQEDLPMMQESIARSARELSLWKHQWRIRTRSGKLKWLEATGKPIRSEDGATYWDTLIMDISENKKSEIALAEKTFLLERTESVAHIGSWEWDTAQDKVYWSTEVYRIFGMEPGEPTPKLEEHSRYFSASSFREIKHAISRAIHHGEPYEVEVTLYPRKGNRKFCISRGLPRANREGKITHLYGSFQDVTHLKETEIRLRESREMLNNIADNIPGIVYRYQLFPDGTDRLLFLSKGVENLLGISHREAFQNVNLLWNCIHPNDLENYKASVEKSAREISFWQVEHRILMPEGRIKWIKGLGKPHKTEDGSIVWDSMGIDITEQKEASEKLQVLKDQLDLAVDIAELGVFSYDLFLDQLDMSPRMEEILDLDDNHSPASMHEWTMALVADDQEKARAAFQSNLCGKKVSNLQLRVRRARGKTGYISFSSVPIGKEGQLSSILGIVYDITQFKEIERDLLKARDKAERNSLTLSRKNAELKKANEELDHFVYSTSHNLRAPLTSVLGLTSLLKDASQQSKIVQLTTYIEKSIHRLDETITEIINYSKNNRLSPQYERIPIQAFVQEILESLSYMNHAKRLQVKTTFSGINELTNDAFRLRIIFENLVSNAIKYQNLQASRPFLKILIKPSGENILIRLEDNGIGIKPAYADQVFDMFFRGSNQGSGSGLGLYIVREAVHKLGGSIAIDTAYEQGTRFDIHLPNHD